MKSGPILASRLGMCQCFVVAAVLLSTLDVRGRPRGMYVEDFFRRATMASPVISPDGKRLLYAKVVQGLEVLHVLDIQSGREEKQFVTIAPNHRFTLLGWVTDERLVYQSNFSDIVAINADGSDRMVLFNADRVLFSYLMILIGDFGFPKLLSMVPNDPKHVVISAFDLSGYREVYKVNIHDAERIVLQKKNRKIHRWLADQDGDIRAGVAHNRNRVDVYYRPAGSRRWKTLQNFLGRQNSMKFSYSGETIAGRHQVPLGFDFDSNILYFASNHERDTMGIYTLDISTGQAGPLVTGDPDYDMVNDIDPSNLMYSSQKLRRIVGFAYQGARLKTKWMDPSFEQMQRTIDERLPGMDNLLIGSDRDENLAVLVSSSSREPGRFWLYSREKGKLREIGRAAPWIDSEEMTEMRPIEFTARDGLPIKGYLTLPLRTPKGQRVPLVVLVHGGPWVRDHYRYHPEVQLLAYNGYGVLQVNYRGSAGFGYKHLDAARRNYGFGALRDLEDSVKWVISEGVADPERIAIMGASYGGYATMMALVQNPGRFRCGIAMSRIYDLVLATEDLKRRSPSRIPLDYWTAMVGDIKKGREELQKNSPISYLQAQTEPVLIVHGRSDRVASFEQAENLVRELDRLGTPHEFISLQGEQHGISKMRHIVMVYERILEFLETHMGASAAVAN